MRFEGNLGTGYCIWYSFILQKSAIALTFEPAEVLRSHILGLVLCIVLTFLIEFVALDLIIAHGQHSTSCEK